MYYFHLAMNIEMSYFLVRITFISGEVVSTVSLEGLINKTPINNTAI